MAATFVRGIFIVAVNFPAWKFIGVNGSGYLRLVEWNVCEFLSASWLPWERLAACGGGVGCPGAGLPVCKRARTSHPPTRGAGRPLRGAARSGLIYAKAAPTSLHTVTPLRSGLLAPVGFGGLARLLAVSLALG